MTTLLAFIQQMANRKETNENMSKLKRRVRRIKERLELEREGTERKGMERGNMGI